MSTIGEMTAGKFPWPPVIYGAALACGFGLDKLIHLPVVSDLPFTATIGTVLLILGVGLLASALSGFFRARTTFLIFRPTTSLVTCGIYRYTRNAMYLGLTIILIGLAFIFNNAWFVLVAPLAAVAITYLSIVPEERYLETTFGEDYREYCRRVRRWF